MVRVSWNMILERLKYRNISLNKAYKGDFHKVRLLSKYETSISPEVLYVTSEEILNKFLAMENFKSAVPINFVCIKECDEEAVLPSEVNCLYLSNEYDLFMTYNILEDLFLELLNWEMKLNEIIIGNKEIQKILDESEKFFNNPILIWDASFNIIGNTRIFFNNELLNKVINDKVFPKEVIDHVVAKRLLAKNITDKTKYLSKNDSISGCSSYIRHHFNNGVRSYSIGYFLVKALPSKAELELLEYLFDKFEDYLKINFKETAEYNYLHELFLRELLNGKLINPEKIQEKAKCFNVPFDSNYILYKILIKEFNTSQAKYLIQSLSQTLPNEKFLIYQDSIILLKRKDAYSCSDEIKQDRFKKLLKINGACCGISSTFTNLLQIRSAYKQAAAAIELGLKLDSKEESIFLYKNYYLYHMLELAEKEIDLHMLYYHKLNLLVEKDHSKKNNNLEILKVYFENNMSVPITANIMHLHRNSVIYRINRIQELLGVNFSEHEIVFRIELSLKILEYLSKCNTSRKA